MSLHFYFSNSNDMGNRGNNHQWLMISQKVKKYYVPPPPIEVSNTNEQVISIHKG